jgi:DUF1680 family protein
MKANRGYVGIRRRWQKGDVAELSLPMPIERIEAHPKVRQNSGRVALQRGPIVYCLEEVDNGKDLNDWMLPRTAKLTATFDPGLLGGVVKITGKARRRDPSAWSADLYRRAASPFKTVPVEAVPYAVWANRKPGEMIVWIRTDD